MGQFFDDIPEFLQNWIKKQHIFWVATAPLDPEGHVNISTKGFEGTFHIVDSHRVWYEDLTGSGVETISHLRENGRITVLFNAFEGPPRIARLFGKGTVYEFGTPEYDAILPAEKRQTGSRAVIMIDVHKSGSSCGYAVPFFDFKAPRNTLHEYFEKVERAGDSEKGLRAYWTKKNLKSIDGLPALQIAPNTTRPIKPCDNNTVASDNLKVTVKSAVLKSPILQVVDKNLLIGFFAGVLTCVVCVKLA
ncbi:hypothetical protein C8J56DRAFT_936434 [Mycena floridula]|nr:hypothetical protein C8J56DRAFT_936434 [Mycena floridula]